MRRTEVLAVSSSLLKRRSCASLGRARKISARRSGWTSLRIGAARSSGSFARRLAGLSRPGVLKRPAAASSGKCRRISTAASVGNPSRASITSAARQLDSVLAARSAPDWATSAWTSALTSSIHSSPFSPRSLSKSVTDQELSAGQVENILMLAGTRISLLELAAPQSTPFGLIYYPKTEACILPEGRAADTMLQATKLQRPGRRC